MILLKQVCASQDRGFSGEAAASPLAPTHKVYRFFNRLLG
jgi:hypothetical protein